MKTLSTAATTAFVTEYLHGPDGRGLWFDGNAKITASGGTFESPLPNAFSLVQVADCPYSTPTCRAACYVWNLEQAQPEIHAKYAHNSRTIREILADPWVADAWAGYVAQYVQRRAEWRWHVSGDVFSAEYAEWIADVCEMSPGTQHWIYTRSFPFVPILRRAGNLTINLSADADNYQEALRTLLPGLRGGGDRICYMTIDGFVPPLLPGDVVFPDYSLRGRDGAWRGIPVHERRLICPVDAIGKSDAVRCGPCRKCIDR